MLIHDLYPVAARGAGRGGARQRAPVHGVATAATSSCSGSRTASPGSGSRAAATAARPRRRRSSWRSSRRSTRRRPTSRAWSSRARSTAPQPATPGPAPLELPVVQVAPRRGRRRRRAGSTLDGRRAARRGRADAAPRSAASSWSWPASRATCSPTATRCAGCGSRARRRRARRGHARPAPSASARFYLPRAGRSLDDDRLQLEPVPLLGGAGGHAGGAAGVSDRSDERRARRADRGAPPGRAGRRPAPPAPRRRRRATGRGNGAAGRGAGEERCDLCGKRARPRPPPPAPPRRAPDPLRLRELRGAALRRPGAAPDRHADACGSTTSTLRRASGRRSGSRSASPSSSTRAPPAASSPSTRARPGRPSPSSSSTPGASCASANPVLDEPRARRRGADRQPDGRPAAARDRPDRRVLPAGRADQGRTGRGSPAAPGSSGRSTAFFDELRESGPRERRPSGDARRRQRPSGAPSPPRGRPIPSSRSSARAPVERAAAPDARLHGPRRPTTPGARVYTIALTAVITIEPSKRRYDDAEPRAPGRAVRRARALGVDHDQLPLGAGRRAGAGFTGSTEFELAVPCTYDLELAATKYFDGLADGEAPLRFHFNGTVFYEADDGRMQIVQVPWDRSPRFRMPVEVWRGDDRRRLPVPRLGPAGHARRSSACERRKAERGLPTFDATRRPSCSTRRGGRVMHEALEQLVASLLYEGYALYPYTPGATKNATPTPFGIVYPPAYAEALPTHLRPPAGRVRARGRAARPSCGRRCASCRPRASATRRPSAGSSSAAAARRARRRPVGEPFEFDGERAAARAGRGCAPSRSASRACWRVRACVHNTTDGRAPRRLERAEALRGEPALHPRRARGRAAGASSRRSSTRARPARRSRRARTSTPARCSPRRPTTRCSARRSCCPTTRGSRRRASATCSTTPRSRRRCCCTCTRSRDAEREAIAEQDPAVREMVERAAATTPEEMIALHGRLEPSAAPQRRPTPATRAAAEPGHPNPGEAELEVDGVTFRKGAQGGPAPGHRARRLRPDARRAHGDDRAALPRLRRTAPTSR